MNYKKNIFRRLIQIARTLIRRILGIFGPPLPQVVRTIRADKLSYLSLQALGEIYYSIKEIEQEGIQGTLIEAGCALGGSAIVIATAKSETRPLNVYDVFDMIPPPTDEDGSDVHQRYEIIKNGQAKGIGDAKYYGYEKNLYEIVSNNFRTHDLDLEKNNIQLIKGLFEDAMYLEGPVAFAHIDGDWYNSVITCLERIVPKLVPGGRLIIDDYDSWSGCRKAVDQYFAGGKDQFKFTWKSRLHIIRK